MILHLCDRSIPLGLGLGGLDALSGRRKLLFAGQRLVLVLLKRGHLVAAGPDVGWESTYMHIKIEVTTKDFHKTLENLASLDSKNLIFCVVKMHP